MQLKQPSIATKFSKKMLVIILKLRSALPIKILQQSTGMKIIQSYICRRVRKLYLKSSLVIIPK
jgi:hypothetical protein